MEVLVERYRGVLWTYTWRFANYHHVNPRPNYGCVSCAANPLANHVQPVPDDKCFSPWHQNTLFLAYIITVPMWRHTRTAIWNEIGGLWLSVIPHFLLAVMQRIIFPVEYTQPIPVAEGVAHLLMFSLLHVAAWLDTIAGHWWSHGGDRCQVMIIKNLKKYFTFEAGASPCHEAVGHQRKSLAVGVLTYPIFWW